MSDPFSSIRRKPAAAATYGRKAMAARRIVMSHTSPANNTRALLTLLPVPSISSPVRNADDDSDTSSDLTGDSDGGVFAGNKGFTSTLVRDKPDTEAARAGPAAGNTWTHRTAQSAMTKLEFLYESTKAADTGNPLPSMSHVLLESAKDSWDIVDIGESRVGGSDGVGPAADTNRREAKPVQQTRRILRDNTDIIVTGKSASRAASASTKRTARQTAFKVALESAPRAERPNFKLTKTLPILNSKPTVAAAPEKADIAVGSRTALLSKAKPNTAPLKRVRSITTIASTEQRGSRSNGTNSRLSGSAAKESVILAGDDDDDVWDMRESVLSTTALSQPRDPVRRSSRTKTTAVPPSSREESIEIISDSDNETKIAGINTSLVCTPKAQVGAQHQLYSTQGPSSATLKRLQNRALGRSVVFTYGRPRDGDSDDELDTIFSRRLGLPTTLGVVSQPLLDFAGPMNSNDIDMPEDLHAGAGVYAASKRSRIAAVTSGHLFDFVDLSSVGGSGGCSLYSAEEFKRQLGDIIKGLSTGSSDESLDAACQLLVDGLDQTSFCEELLSNRQWLTMLLQALHRARGSGLALSATIVVVATAFSAPTTMQTLVFERQVLETVAEVLKLTVDSDILSFRCRSDFDSPEQYACISQMCRLARERELLGKSLTLSTYNLALSALHGFTRNDDAAFLAMAGLLRSEVRESGCLGLVVERVLSKSIPGFIQMHGQTSETAKTHSAFDDICAPRAFPGSKRMLLFGSCSADCAASGTKGSEADDLWMDFDLPEESKNVSKMPVVAPPRRARSSKEATTAAAASTGRQTHTVNGQLAGSFRTGGGTRHALQEEPDGAIPTYASIAVELEFLRFCTTASDENQDEMLGVDTCVPILLSLLTVCQQSSARLQGARLIRALETAALTLQLLVNLSNSSTVFCARFIAEQGLDVVSKSIALVSQKISSPDVMLSARQQKTCDFSPRRKALLDEAGDLRYDILLITSAMLTNLVESDPSAALYFGHVLQSPRCALSDRCFPECTCADRKPLTILLTQAFLACHSSAGNSADAAIAAGYISVLLGFLMRERTAGGRELILKQLPGRDTSLVVSHIKQFICVSDSVNQRFGGLIGGLAMVARNYSQQCTMIDDNAGDSGGNNSMKLSAAAALRRGGTSTNKSAMATSLQSIIDSLCKM
ncbi:hypothetical protein LPJ66_004974 [Kickxella alabastrina]|uniref:Uncharacterized protein n=1 Tax=Kickxella alabastrina TaxID=61397 RepID=A0ACC1IGG0_9FUNG|nr:hypothetical protein LPJ66_004974 [Kickxella alabastrina]